MRKRTACANIFYDRLIATHKKSREELIELLQQRKNDKAQVINSKKILNDILNDLEKFK